MLDTNPDWTITYRSIVLPKHCDHYGHMNVRFYSEHFDDGGFQMWHTAGVSQSDLTRNDMGTVVANISIAFIHEITAGQLIEIWGGWTHVGGKSLTHEQRMYEADSGTLCAIQETVEVAFDMKARNSAPLPEDIKAKISAHVLAPEKLVR